MSEPGKSDRWNSLLETLGVPASESKPQPSAAEAPPVENPLGAKPQPVSMLPPAKAKAAPKPKPAPPAAKSPSYWSRIAGALGLDVPAVPEPPPVESLQVPQAEERREQEVEQVEQPPRHRAREPMAREHDLPPRAFGRANREERPPREGRHEREERSAREDRPRREERPRSDEPPSRPALNEMFGPKAPDIDVFGFAEEETEKHRSREPNAPAGRETDENGSVLDYDAPAAAGSDLEINEPLGHEAQHRGDEGPEQEGSRRRRRRRGRGRGRRGSREPHEADAPRHEADIEPAGEEADFDLARDELARDEEMELDTEFPERAPRPEIPDEERGGRRHRRSRSSSRERQTRGTGRMPPKEAEAGERAGFGSPRDQRSGSTQDAPDLDDELESDSIELDDDRGGDVPTHKKIPTWDDAVGFLIEANMANRGPDRDRGRGRGRR